MNDPQSNLKFIINTLTGIHNNSPSVIAEFLSNQNAQDAMLMLRLQDIGGQLARIRDKFPKF